MVETALYATGMGLRSGAPISKAHANAPVLEKASVLVLASRLFPVKDTATKENPADDPSRLRRLRFSWK